MPDNQNISPEGLRAVLEYLKKNPTLAILQDGGEIPKYQDAGYFNDPTFGTPYNPYSAQFGEAGAAGRRYTEGYNFPQPQPFPGLEPFSTPPTELPYDPYAYELGEMNPRERGSEGRRYLREEGYNVPPQPISEDEASRLTTYPGLGRDFSSTGEMSDDWRTRLQDRQAGRSGEDLPMTGSEGVYNNEFMSNDWRVRRADRQAQRSGEPYPTTGGAPSTGGAGAYGSLDEITDAFGRGEIKPEAYDQTRADFQAGLRPSPAGEPELSKRDARRERRGDFDFAGAASLVGAAGSLLSGTMSGIRDGVSLLAREKRNRYVKDWYQKQQQRRDYTPVSQAANANYLGGFSYGEDGGEKGKSLDYYQNGGEERRHGKGLTLRPNQYGKLNMFDVTDEYIVDNPGLFPEEYVEGARETIDSRGHFDKSTDIGIERNFRESARLARSTNQRIREQELPYQKVKMGAFVDRNPQNTELEFQDGGQQKSGYEGGGQTMSPNHEGQLPAHFKVGEFISFEYGGKMYEGTVKKSENGKIYI